MAKMEELLGEGDREKDSAYEITQFLRAKVYLLVEKILSFPPDLLTKQESKDLVGFLEYYIKFAVGFNRKCLRVAGSCFEELVSNKESYLMNPKVAQVTALTEVYLCLELILSIKGEFRNKLYKTLPEKETRFRNMLS